MNYNQLNNILSNTGNNKKIIAEFSKLSPKERQIVLSNNRIKQRIIKIGDINLLVALLIDLPYEFRINFINSIDINLIKSEIKKEENYLETYELSILNFLKLKDYNDFNIEELKLYKDLMEKKTLLLMFKKLSEEKLNEIILNNYNKSINDYSFVAICKKNNELNLREDIINNVSDEVLFTEVKKRNNNQKPTKISVEELNKLPPEKQKVLLSNDSFKKLKEELLNKKIFNILNMRKKN